MSGRNEAMTGARIAVVEDDPNLRESLALFLRVKGCRVETFGSAEEACGTGDLLRFDAVISDYLLPGEDGLSFLRRIRETPERVVTILITAYRGKELSEEARRAGVDRLLRKPFSSAEMENTLHGLIGKGREVEGGGTPDLTA